MLGDRPCEFGVVVGRASQAVVDVTGGDLAACRERERHQCSGVGAAGQAARDGGATRRKAAPDEKVSGVEQRNASVGDP